MSLSLNRHPAGQFPPNRPFYTSSKPKRRRAKQAPGALSKNEAEQRDQGIYPNTVRLSIGLENAKDIIADLKQAFEG